MKKLLLSACFAFSILPFAFAQCVCISQWPAGTVTPTPLWSTINTLMYAGDYAVVNVTAGNTYEFSTCSTNGSNVAYDSELTLLSDQQQLLVYNDDFCGIQSFVSWVATYTGTVQIHLTEYTLGSGCWTNSTNSSVRYRYVAGAVTIPANNLCANATSLTPAANCNLTSGTTLGASEDPYPDPPCDMPGVYNDVWYSFNSGAFTSLNLTVNLGTAALIGVEFYSGCGTLAAGLSLGGIPGNCDFNTNAPNPTVITGLTPNTTYRMRLFTNASYDPPGTFTVCLTTPTPPTVSVNSTSICAGQSVTLTATPSTAGGTYLWSNGATTPTITVTPNATTNYSVTYSNNGTANGSGTVTVNPAPTINGGQDQTVCAGTSVTLNGTGGATYTWNNGISNGVAFVANATTTYTVTGTNANGCTNTDQVTVTVNAAPTVNAINNQTLCAGASATAVIFSGTAGATYAWVNSNPSIGLSASGSGNIAGFTGSNATGNPITGTITVTPSQAGCTGTPQTYTYTVNPTPAAPTASNQALCAGQTSTINASSMANWYTVPVGGVSIGQASSYTTGPLTSGTYTYHMEGVSGPCVSPSRNAVTITVNPNPTISGNTVLCPSTTSQLTGTGTAAANNAWTSSNAAVASISNTGVVTAISFGTSTITYTANTGCSVTNTVNVSNPTAPAFNPIAAICAGGVISLPGASTNNIQGTWTPAVNNTQTTTYTFTPSAGQCATTAQLTVNVNPLPAINAGLDQTVCQGANVTLSGTGGSTYSWNNGVSNGVAFVPNATTTYTLTGTNANGCANTDQVTVTVSPNPTLSGNTVICPNTTSQLTANANPAASNAWISSNTATATVSNTGLVTALSFGTSTITFTNNNGCTAITTINVSNPTAPAFNPIAAVCAGGVISLPGASTNNIQGTWTPAVNNTQTTTYTFTPSAGQCATTAQLTVNVNPLPAINAGLDQAVCQGANVTLSGTGGSTYSWNNGVSNGVAFVPNATTTYTLTGTNANGCANTDQVTVTVSPNPTLSGNTVICPNTTSQLTANANPAALNPWTSSNTAIATVSNTGLVTAVSFGTSTITFTNNNGCSATSTINVSNPTAPAFNPIAAICAGGVISLPGASTNNIQGTWTPAVNNTQTTTYTFTPSAGQCATTAQLTVNVNPLPTINAGLDQTVCQGANVTLSGTGGSTYSWNNGVSNGVAFVPNATTTYTLTGTNANGCANTDQVTVTVSPNPTLSGNTVICPNTTSQLTANANPAASNAWTSSNTAIATVSNTGLVTAVSFGTSTITFTNNNGCTAITTINVSNPTAPAFNPIAAICAGGVISLPGASTNNIQGTWTPAVNNTQTTTYTFTPSAGQCATTAQLTVNVNPLPTINAGLDQTVCQGANVTLSGTGGSTYSWNNGVSNGVAFVPNTTTTYTVTGTNANGCANTDQVTVTVSPNPTLSGNTVICPNTTSQLTANANPAALNAWTSSNTAIATISNTGLVNALSFGTSTITFTNNNGCTATTTINVTNPIAPTFNPIAAICSGGNITLPVASTNNVQGTWSPAVNNSQTTTYTFTPSAGQCATTAQQTVTVNPNPSISGGSSVCVGSTLQLTGSGIPAVNAPWVSGTAAIGSVSNSGLFTALSPGTSVLTYMNSNGCSATTTVTVQGAVNALPQQVTACLSYLWNGQTYSQSGTYTDTLQTVAGCDSIATLNLTISNSITGPTTQQNACGPYTWNGQTYTQSGTYTYNGTTANGCDSSATLVLTIDLAPSNVQLSLNQGTFTVTAQNANAFAWIDCATNTLIPGETSATFTPTLSGSYAAVVSNACGSDTTTCEPIEVQGISEMNNELMVVYPNPSVGIFNVVSKGSTIHEIYLYSIKGELLSRKTYNANEITLDLSDFAQGTYMLQVTTNQQSNMFRLIKQ